MTTKDLEMLSHRFKQNGYSTTTAGDGKIALELASQQSFDLILLDIEMPEMRGLEVLKVLRQSKSPTELPVIMISANHDSADIVEALSLGAATTTRPNPFIFR